MIYFSESKKRIFISLIFFIILEAFIIVSLAHADIISMWTKALRVPVGGAYERIKGAQSDLAKRVMARGVDGSQIQIYVDREGVIEEIDRLGKEYGLIVYFAGGTARRMLFHKAPFAKFSDLDLMVQIQGKKYNEFTAQDIRAVSEFNQALNERYSFMEIDIMNYTEDFNKVENLYATSQDERCATVDRMLIARNQDGDWIVSDETEGDYMHDASAKVIKLVLPINKVGKPVKLTFEGVVRFLRLIAEFPDAIIDNRSIDEINAFVDKNFENFIMELNKFKEAYGDMLMRGSVPPYKALIKVFTNAQDLERTIELLKSTGMGDRSLYNLFKDYVNLEKIAEIIDTARSRGRDINMHDFDSAFLGMSPKMTKLTRIYSIEEFIDFIKEELRGLPAVSEDGEMSKIANFIEMELGQWINRTTNIEISFRAVHRYWIKNVFINQILGSNLDVEWRWVYRVKDVVSKEFYAHIFEHKYEIYSAIKSGTYKNLLDYYFKVYRANEEARESNEFSLTGPNGSRGFSLDRLRGKLRHIFRSL